MTRQAISLVALFSVAACGADTPTIITATLSITSPTNNSTVNLPGGTGAQVVPVNFSTNWNLKGPGECGTDTSCGHIDILVDSTTCNDGSKSWNAQAVSSPAQADFGKCATAKGQHTITLELHNDADASVKDLIGNVVVSKVTVTAQ